MQNEREGGFTAGTTSGVDRPTSPGGIGVSPSGGMHGGETTSDRTEELKSMAKERAKEAGQQAVDRIEDRAEQQKDRATHQLEDIARSLRVARDQLPQDNGISRYMGMAATQVDNLASFLNNNDVADLVDDIEDFARRQPGLFVGGAFAAGMLGARFLKSSRRNLVDEGVRERWETDAMTRRVRDPEQDAVSRPNAPGYAAPSERGEGTMGPGRSI